MKDKLAAIRNWVVKHWRNLLAAVLILVGVAIIGYAVVMPIYTNYKNKQMIELAKQQMEENKRRQEEEAKEQQAQEEAGSNSEEGLSEEEQAQIQKDQEINKTLDSQEIIGILKIEKLGIEYAIVEGTERLNIRVAVGRMTEGAQIGAVGNCVIAGHRGGHYGEFFKNIDQLTLGDKIVLTDLNGVDYTYEVYESEVIEPTDWSVLDALPEKQMLTLLTCEDNAQSRLVVRAIVTTGKK